MSEFSHITTRGGDGGDTSLLGGKRRSKDDDVFEVLGTLDELSSVLGLFRASLSEASVLNSGQTRRSDTELYIRRIRKIQEHLLQIGGIAALPVHGPESERIGSELLKDALRDEYWIERIGELETWETEAMKHLRIDGFIIPGDTRIGACGDFARTVCRRLERVLVRYIRKVGTPRLFEPQKYLNRLSDYLFVVVREMERKL